MDAEAEPMISLKLVDGTDWICQQGLSCWWDTGSMSTEETKASVPVVLQYNQKTGEYTVEGHFCSANCAKSYLLKYSSPIMKEKRTAWQQAMYQKYFKLQNHGYSTKPPKKRKKLTKEEQEEEDKKIQPVPKMREYASSHEAVGTAFCILQAPSRYLLNTFRKDGDSLELYRNVYCRIKNG